MTRRKRLREDIGEQSSRGLDLASDPAEAQLHKSRAISPPQDDLDAVPRSPSVPGSPGLAVAPQGGRGRGEGGSSAAAPGLALAARQGPFSEEKRKELAAKILDSMGPAVYSFDTEGSVLTWSESAARLFGHSAEQVLGRNIVRLLCAQDCVELAHHIIRTCLLRGLPWAGRLPLKTRQGGVFDAVIFNTPLLNDDGDLWAIIGVVHPSHPTIPYPSQLDSPCSTPPRLISHHGGAMWRPVLPLGSRTAAPAGAGAGGSSEGRLRAEAESYCEARVGGRSRKELGREAPFPGLKPVSDPYDVAWRVVPYGVPYGAPLVHRLESPADRQEGPTLEERESPDGGLAVRPAAAGTRHAWDPTEAQGCGNAMADSTGADRAGGWRTGVVEPRAVELGAVGRALSNAQWWSPVIPGTPSGWASRAPGSALGPEGGDSRAPGIASIAEVVAPRAPVGALGGEGGAPMAWGGALGAEGGATRAPVGALGAEGGASRPLGGALGSEGGAPTALGGALGDEGAAARASLGALVSEGGAPWTPVGALGPEGRAPRAIGDALGVEGCDLDDTQHVVPEQMAVPAGASAMADARLGGGSLQRVDPGIQGPAGPAAAAKGLEGGGSPGPTAKTGQAEGGGKGSLERRKSLELRESAGSSPGEPDEAPLLHGEGEGDVTSWHQHRSEHEEPGGTTLFNQVDQLMAGLAKEGPQSGGGG